MDKFHRLIEFESETFPRVKNDEELVNSETMCGYFLSRYIGLQIRKSGLAVRRYIAEDWGWYCEVDREGPWIAYGVCSEDDGHTFLIQFIPRKPIVRHWFKKHDLSDIIIQLQDAVFDALARAPKSNEPRWIEG